MVQNLGGSIRIASLVDHIQEYRHSSLVPLRLIALYSCIYSVAYPRGLRQDRMVPSVEPFRNRNFDGVYDALSSLQHRRIYRPSYTSMGFWRLGTSEVCAFLSSLCRTDGTSWEDRS